MAASAPPATRRSPWRPTLHWGITGFFITFGIAGLLSIGVFFLLAAVGMIVWGVIGRVSPRGLPAALIGGGLTPLYIAAINWRGPGMFCRETPTGQSCSEHLDPTLFMIVGVSMVLLGTVLLITTRRS